jgi:pSer/pThr/pTyr-binding forkhead associated (FHA) protein
MGSDGGYGPPPAGDGGYSDQKDAQRPRQGASASTALGGANAPARGGAVGQDGRRALAGFLVSYQDDPLGKFWPLWQGRNGIGRADTGQKLDIEIAHGTTSTHHAAIDCEGGRFVLHDLGSTNGTFHNEDAIGFKGRRELRDGDKIRFGGFSVITIIVTART